MDIATVHIYDTIAVEKKCATVHAFNKTSYYELLIKPATGSGEGFTNVVELAIRRRPSATNRVRKRSRRLVDQFLQTLRRGSCATAQARRQKSCFSGEESS